MNKELRVLVERRRQLLELMNQENSRLQQTADPVAGQVRKRPDSIQFAPLPSHETAWTEHLL